MRWRYSKYRPEDFDVDAEELMRALADYFLQSGFEGQFQEWDPNALEELRRAILEALMSGELFPPGEFERRLEELNNLTPEQLDELLNRMVEKLAAEGYINVQPSGQGSGEGAPAKVQITDQSLDFLGFKAFKDLLGSLGRSSFGAHDTRDLSTGVESSGATKPYEFGDTLNLDASETLFSALRRNGLSLPLDLDYEDLRLHQSEY